MTYLPVLYFYFCPRAFYQVTVTPIQLAPVFIIYHSPLQVSDSFFVTNTHSDDTASVSLPDNGSRGLSVGQGQD